MAASTRRRESAKSRRAEMRALAKLSAVRPLTSEQVARHLYLIDLTCRIRHKPRAAPVAPTPTPELEQAARYMLIVLNMPAHIIEQETGITRNRLSQWLGSRP